MIECLPERAQGLQAEPAPLQPYSESASWSRLKLQGSGRRQSQAEVIFLLPREAREKGERSHEDATPQVTQMCGFPFSEFRTSG